MHTSNEVGVKMICPCCRPHEFVKLPEHWVTGCLPCFGKEWVRRLRCPLVIFGRLSHIRVVTPMACLSSCMYFRRLLICVSPYVIFALSYWQVRVAHDVNGVLMPVTGKYSCKNPKCPMAIWSAQKAFTATITIGHFGLLQENSPATGITTPSTSLEKL